MEGYWPGGQIDHINLIKDDDRWCNLREATPSQNGANTRLRADNKSGFKGVCWGKRDRRWTVKIRVNGKVINLGNFDCPSAAHFAYIVAADKHHGEFARVR